MALSTYAELKTEIDREGKWASAHDAQIPEWIERAEDWMFTYPSFRIRCMEAMRDVVLKANLAIGASALGGTANAITITNSTTKTSNTIGDTYSFTVETTNTAAVTINVDGIGAVDLKQGYNASEAIAAGDMPAGSKFNIYFDGTQFVIIPPGAASLPSDYLAMRRLYIPTDPLRKGIFMDTANFWDRYLSSTNGVPQHYTIEGDFIVFGPTADSDYYCKMMYYKRLAALSSDTDTNWILSNARGLYLYRALAEGYGYLNDTGNQLKFQTMADNLIEQVIDADKDDRHSGSELIQQSDVGEAGHALSNISTVQ